MENINELPILSVFEALDILKFNNSITCRAVKNISIKCNIPQNIATEGRLNRHFCKVLKERSNARKRGHLDTWLAESKLREFCKYLPEANTIEDHVSSDESMAVTPPKQARRRGRQSTKKP